MPITENSFSAEEFQAAAAANPELQNIVTGVLKANKLVVQTPEEHQQFLTNHEAVVVSKKTGEHAAAIEKDVFELTGVAKEGAEKYYDYMKRAVGAKLADVPRLQKELEDLRAKGGNPNEVDKARITELERKISETETSYKEKLGAREKELIETRASYSVQAAIAANRGKYKADIPKSLVTLAENSVVNQLMSSAREMDVDGKPTIVFVNEKNEVVIDQATMKPADAAYFVGKTEALKDLIDEGRQQGGSGTDPKDTGKTGGEPGKYSGLPSDVKTKVQLTDHLKKLGIQDGTKEFIEIFDRDGAALPLR